MTWDNLEKSGGQPDEEAAIDEVLGDNPRAENLKQMVAALQERRALLIRERDAAGSEPERDRWEARTAEVDRQIEALRRETAVASFVETSVRLAVRRSSEEDTE
jgi:hypothetical protein